MLRHRARLVFRIVCLAVLPATACYHYVPAVEPEPGAEVRARLNRTGAESLTPHFGPGVSELTGTLLSREGSDVSVLVAEYSTARLGTQSIWNEAVRLPFAGIEELQRRELHVGRSVLFAAAIVASASLAFVALDLGDRVFDDDDGIDPGPSEARVPWSGFTLFRLPLGKSGR